MSERTKLLKRAVLTSVGASTNVDRIREALNDAMGDLVKVGQDLLDDLEAKGKLKAESVQNFLRNLQDEASKRTGEIEKKVSSKMQVSMKKAAKEFGLITREDFDELLERLTSLEEALVGPDEEVKKTRASRGKRAAQQD